MDSTVISNNTRNAPSVKPLIVPGGLIVFLGDSLIQGTGVGATDANNTVVQKFQRLEWATDWFKKRNAVAYNAMNKGISGQRSTEIAARYDADVRGNNADMVLLEGGINDVVHGDVTSQQTIAAWTEMLDKSAADNRPVIACTMPPWTAGTNTQMDDVDARNALLIALLQSYPIVKTIVFPRTLLGQYRAGGPDGNLWDIRNEYRNYNAAGDGIHYNDAGQTQFARAIWEAM